MKDNYQSIPLRVASQIRDMVFVTKELKANDKLDNERDLAVSLGVSRNSVREAIKILIAEGVLVNKRSRGTYVAENPTRTRDPLGLSLMQDRKLMLRDWYETRLIVEPSMARLAAERATESEVDEIAYLGKIKLAETQTSEEFAEVDEAFHKAIAKATHNFAIEKLVPYLEESVREGALISTLDMWHTKAREHSIKLHYKIAESIEKKDGNSAYLYMQFHIMQGLEDMKQ